MKIGVLKETRPNENRVAITPKIAKDFIDKGFEVLVEKDAGLASAFDNESYEAVSAKVVNKNTIFKDADVIVKINPLEDDEIKQLKKGQMVISMVYHRLHPETVEKIAKQGATLFSMDAIPRISRAQNMDVLSSQSNLAGYKAVILGADNMSKIFPLMMTAAGTITPAKVLIYGVGVAGLQAIATAKRLGAVVEATDVRPETKEQAESLGAKFISVENDSDDVSEGGYAKEQSAEFLQKQKEAVNKSLFDADLVVTTALVQGAKAPVLITEDQIKQMKRGAVIVDMAVEKGGNVALSEPDKTVEKYGVKIIGKTNLPSTLATNASELYAKNLYNFVTFMADKDGFHYDLDEEITKNTLLAKDGQVLIK
ncbi:MAG TPA: Re/Si-specific NAD(P)(+) transhydrogenase subunit alpha [Flavobacteriales bacterium]|jgi:NAD(P) transhydrogenase subunit alpha|nr:Re/Si-specific NAD(P)(+) transhydrogenase subunit alpha [Flavobacteriales bacterium]